MALVHRGDRCYYYESYRRGGRVTSRYLFAGELAVAHAAIQAHQRRRLARLRRKTAALALQVRELARRWRRVWAARRADLEAIEALVGEFGRRAGALFRCDMMVAGYHRHRRGEWRRRRTMATPGERPADGAGPDGAVPLRELVRRAAAGDETVVPALKAHLASGGLLQGLLDIYVGDVGGAAESALVRYLAGG